MFGGVNEGQNYGAHLNFTSCRFSVFPICGIRAIRGRSFCPPRFPLLPARLMFELGDSLGTSSSGVWVLYSVPMLDAVFKAGKNGRTVLMLTCHLHFYCSHIARFVCVASLCVLMLALAGCQTAPRPGTFVQRTGDEIVVCGQFVHTGTPVVLWIDPGGYDAYRVER